MSEKLPSVLVLTGSDNDEIEKFLKSLVASGLVENTLRSYSSTKINLFILREVILVSQNAREEIARLTAENERLMEEIKKMLQDGATVFLQERVRVLEYERERIREVDSLEAPL